MRNKMEKRQPSEQSKARSMFYKTFALNEKTGRMNQILQCTVCPTRFTKLCNVMDHARMHINYRPYSCERCGMTFAQKGNKLRHEKSLFCGLKQFSEKAQKKDVSPEPQSKKII